MKALLGCLWAAIATLMHGFTSFVGGVGSWDNSLCCNVDDEWPGFNVELGLRAWTAGNSNAFGSSNRKCTADQADSSVPLNWVIQNSPPLFGPFSDSWSAEETTFPLVTIRHFRQRSPSLSPRKLPLQSNGMFCGLWKHSIPATWSLSTLLLAQDINNSCGDVVWWYSPSLYSLLNNILSICQQSSDKNDVTFLLITRIFSFDNFTTLGPPWSCDSVEKLLFLIKWYFECGRNNQTYCSLLGIKYTENDGLEPLSIFERWAGAYTIITSREWDDCSPVLESAWLGLSYGEGQRDIIWQFKFKVLVVWINKRVFLVVRH